MTRLEEEFYMTQIKAAKRIAELLETRRESAKTDEKIAGHLNDISMSLARIRRHARSHQRADQVEMSFQTETDFSLKSRTPPRKRARPGWIQISIHSPGVPQNGTR